MAKDMTTRLNRLFIKSQSAINDSLVNQLPVNVFLIDEKGYIAWGNNQMLKTLGLSNLDDFFGKHVGSWEEERWLLCKQIIASRKEQVVEEFANGKFYLTTRKPVIGDSGDVTGVLGVSLDITKQKQAEIAKNEFLLNMQHDLRTPFSGILSVSKLLHDTEKDAGRKELQKMVIDSADRLLQLLDQVLEISKLGDNPLSYTEFNVKQVAEEVYQLLRAEIHTKGLEFNLYCPDTIIKSDMMRFSRILMNLLGNAVKFTEKGAIGLKIALNDYLLIEVVDTGIGIPASKLDFIFEKFAKLKPSNTQPNFSGSGIGLHIVKQFVDELGGVLQVQSQLGKGTAFTCKLPLLRID